MNIFCDYHHADLYYALHLLFEKRFGHKLYRPIGLEWNTQGYWKYHKWQSVIDQYLRPTGKEILKNGYYECDDPTHETTTKALTYEQFKKMDIDIIIASVPENTECYHQLKISHKPNAKLIQHVGNQWTELDWRYVKNVIYSIRPMNPPDDVNSVLWRQEFRLDQFKPSKMCEKPTIKNFVNCMHDSQYENLLKIYKDELPEYVFKSFGIGNTDGNISGTHNVAKEMRDMTFAIHMKEHGDGYGHCLHNYYACGKPAIIKGRYYADKLGGDLLTDNVTCIDIDNGTIENNLERIRHWTKPENYKVMSENAYKRFKEVVDFDKEEKDVIEFMERLK